MVLPDGALARKRRMFSRNCTPNSRNTLFRPAGHTTCAVARKWRILSSQLASKFENYAILAGWLPALRCGSQSVHIFTGTRLKAREIRDSSRTPPQAALQQLHNHHHLPDSSHHRRHQPPNSSTRARCPPSVHPKNPHKHKDTDKARDKAEGVEDDNDKDLWLQTKNAYEHYH